MIPANESSKGISKPINFLVISAKRLLIERLRYVYKREFKEKDFETPNGSDQFAENEKGLYFVFKYRSKFLIIIGFDKDQRGQPVLEMTPADKNCEKQFAIIELYESDNFPELLLVPPLDEC